MHTKTSIIATVGPASQSVEKLETLIRFGVSVFRLNFSHGTFETHKQTLDNINMARQSFPYCAAVIGDLCGPKIRVGQIEPGTILTEGRKVSILIGDKVGNDAEFWTTYADLLKDVQVGQRILLDDGQLVLSVTDKKANTIECVVVVGGPLSSKKGMNLPDTSISTAAITQKDWQCVDWAIENQLDYLALSFVQRPDEVKTLKDYLAKKGSRIKVIPKIEKPLAVNNIEAIADSADGIMVARGDLGVEMDLAQVPLVQKQITAICRRLGKPVIIATQVLQSMIENPSPTRAEATDISNAVLELADAVMLSGETAVGKYPLEAVKSLAHICRTTENFSDLQSNPRPPIQVQPEHMQAQAIARSVAQMLDEVKTKCIAVWAQDIDSIRFLSKVRIDVPILSLSSDTLTARQLALYYGMISIQASIPATYDEWVNTIELKLKEIHLASSGDKILMIPPRSVFAKNIDTALILHTIS